MNNVLAKHLKAEIITLGYLRDVLHIDIKEYPTHYILSYNQFASPKTNKYVKEARGLILTKQFEVACQPFTRFFNYGEHGTTINFNKDLKIVEKVDGSLIKFWFNTITQKWEIATNGTAFAETPTPFKLTFRELVLKTLNFDNMEQFNDMVSQYLDQGKTYLFELTTPLNTVIVQHQTYKFTYLACRNNKDGVYVDSWKAVKNIPNVVKVKEYDFANIDQLLNSCNQLNGKECEGFIAYQKGIPVCKIKSDDYIRLFHLKEEGLSTKRICLMICEGEDTEYLSQFPNDKPLFDNYIKGLNLLLNIVDREATNYVHITDSKELALSIKNHKLNYFITNRVKYNQNAKETFMGLLQPKRIELIEYYASIIEQYKDHELPSMDGIIVRFNLRGSENDIS